MNKFATKTLLSSRLGCTKMVALNRSSLPELMWRACAYLRRSGMISLNASSLVHETSLRFSAAGAITPTPRKKFLGSASRVMQAAILYYANERNALKRGGSAATFPLTPGIERAVFHEDSSCSLSDAFKALKWIEAHSHPLINMHYPGGMADEGNSDLFDRAVATVRRGWRQARVFQFDTVAKAVP